MEFVEHQKWILQKTAQAMGIPAELLEDHQLPGPRTNRLVTKIRQAMESQPRRITKK